MRPRSRRWRSTPLRSRPRSQVSPPWKRLCRRRGSVWQSATRWCLACKGLYCIGRRCSGRRRLRCARWRSDSGRPSPGRADSRDTWQTRPSTRGRSARDSWLRWRRHRNASRRPSPGRAGSRAAWHAQPPIARCSAQSSWLQRKRLRCPRRSGRRLLTLASGQQAQCLKARRGRSRGHPPAREAWRRMMRGMEVTRRTWWRMSRGEGRSKAEPSRPRGLHLTPRRLPPPRGPSYRWRQPHTSWYRTQSRSPRGRRC
mmetsp:Transcript_92174/g.231832  ORF Transcript_92174/g.231832 Transcript_92174/m.231832 type:complete len:256 (-) Transcript_92174:202-969(-)